MTRGSRIGGHIINGAHCVVYSTDPEADRAFFRDVVELKHVDVGDGWLIFALPPAEVAVHPSEKNDHHELYLMCDDIEALVAQMAQRDVAHGPTDRAPGPVATIADAR